MSNAAKHRKKAAEFEQLKQIDRAIAAYIKAVEDSEAEGADVDVALLNKVGDLTLRQGRVADAVTYYERAVEHYATSGLFNNAIALCNKILRSAPGRSNVYFTLGRICAKKGLRGDATRNFLEYATRMQQEGRVDEGMRALAEVADLMPELTEVRRLVEEHATRAGIVLPRRKTPVSTAVSDADRPFPRPDNKSTELIFLDLGSGGYTTRNTPPLAPRIQTPARPMNATNGARGVARRTPGGRTPDANVAVPVETQSLDEFLLFDPTRPDAIFPLAKRRAVTPIAASPVAEIEPAAEATSEPEVVVESPVQSPVDAAVEASVVMVREEPIEAAVEPSVEAVVEQSFEAVDEVPVEAAEEVPVEAAEEVPVEAADEEPVEAVEEVPVEAAAEVPIEAVDEVPFEAVEEVPVEAMEAQHVEAVRVVELDASADMPEAEAIQRLDGLEVSGHFADADIEVLQGLTVEEFEPTPAGEEAEPEVTLTWLMSPDSVELSDAVDEEVRVEFSNAMEVQGGVIDGLVIDGLVIEDFEHVADDPDAVAVSGTESGAPTYNTDVPLALTPIEVSPIPELDAAIEAGARAVAMAEAMADSDPELMIRRPPFRLDPHDFILPGELPPLMVDDELVFAGMQFATDAVNYELAPPSAEVETEVEQEAQGAQEAQETGSWLPEAVVEAAVETEALEEAPEESVERAAVDEAVESSAVVDEAADFEAESMLREAIEADRAVRATPSLRIAAVAAEANAVATSRRDELHAAVARAPHDWVLRRRLAEAMFEVGEREGGLSELQTAVSGLLQAGDLASAADIADELVRISPERIPYHQKRVELAVRLSDQQRLRGAYLDLADTLVRMGDDTRAHAVYARVLEIDPWDERARTALGGAAPPPPPKPVEAASDDFVDLAEWLQDDQPASTRMRMREPQVSGDEQADFDSLLRHFKEGVARSLGEEDFESHYDLGVAYKEMGLLDDAIAEFQKALRSRRHRLPAYEALGQCFVEQSRHSVAATVLTRALHEPGPGDEHRVGVLYLLAYSCEALQRWDEARSYYSRVYATDIHFRDVAARMAALDLIAR